MNTASLFFTPKPNSFAHLRLVCFSYAGGNSNHFARWLPSLHPDVELVTCQLPGRGTRLYETPYDNMEILVRDLVKAVARLQDKPLVFFGHSMGAKLAYELGLAMQLRALPLPIHMVISAADAPFRRRQGSPIHQLPDKEFVAAMAELGGTPPQILRNTELMALCLPSLRADYRMVETYINTSKKCLDCQLTLLGGRDDPFVSAEQLAEWASLFDRVIEAFWFQGGHFFINTRSDDVLRFLNHEVLEFNLRRMNEHQRTPQMNFDHNVTCETA